MKIENCAMCRGKVKTMESWAQSGGRFCHCDKCTFSGPVKCTKSQAIQAWNHIQRAVKWYEQSLIELEKNFVRTCVPDYRDRISLNHALYDEFLNEDPIDRWSIAVQLAIEDGWI